MPNSIDNTMFQQHQSNHHVMQPLIHFHARRDCCLSHSTALSPLDSLARSLTELSMFVPARDYTNLANDAIHFPFFRSFLRTPTRTCVFLSFTELSPR